MSTSSQRQDAMKELDNLDEVANLINKASSLLPSWSCRKVRRALADPAVSEAVKMVARRMRATAEHEQEHAPLSDSKKVEAVRREKAEALHFWTDELDRALAQNNQPDSIEAAIKEYAPSSEDIDIAIQNMHHTLDHLLDQVIVRTADMPEWADGWRRAKDGRCRYYSIGFKQTDPNPVVICEAAPNLCPDTSGSLGLPIIDPPKGET